MRVRRKRFRENVIPACSYRRCFAKTDAEGKPGITVEVHCINVGLVALALCEQLGEAVRKLLPEGVIVLVAAHDVGKVSPGFQFLILDDRWPEFLPELKLPVNATYIKKHAVISEAALDRWFDAELELESAIQATIVGSHHGSRKDQMLLTDSRDDMGGEAWSLERRKLLEALVERFGDFPETIDRQLAPVIAGFVTVSDWIGSDETYFPATAGSSARTLAQARQAIQDIGWNRPSIKHGLSFADIFNDWSPRPLQQDFIDAVNGPGLYILEAPMGLGKTEAALYAAYKLMADGCHHGLFFGLPTRLTSDRIHERVDRFIQSICQDPSSVRLAHGHAWLSDHGGEALKPGGSWFNPSKRSLLEPFAVGTIDQALLSVLNVKHAFVRSFGLAGKVVILDEIHSYDPYMSFLINRLVDQLLTYGCSVIILSATLTQSRRISLSPVEQLPESNDYPLITAITEQDRVFHQPAPVQPDVTVWIVDLSVDDIVDSALSKARQGALVLCIANTVAAAQEWYRRAKNARREDDVDVGLLHSRFPGWKRQKIEDEWVDRFGKEGCRNRGCILFGTQILEQSLDLDADFMITELAPTDLIIQRVGRLWRHQRVHRPVACPELLIVTPDLDQAHTEKDLKACIGSNAYVYGSFILLRSYHVWVAHGSTLRLPGDIRNLLETTYAEEGLSPLEEEFKVAHLQRMQRLERLAATSTCKSLPALTDDERAATRYSDYETIDVLLAKDYTHNGRQTNMILSDGQEVQVNQDITDIATTRKLYYNLVSIALYRLPKIPKLWPSLSKHFFSSTPVLRIEDDGALTVEDEPTQLIYNENTGIALDQDAQPIAAGDNYNNDDLIFEHW